MKPIDKNEKGITLPDAVALSDALQLHLLY